MQVEPQLGLVLLEQVPLAQGPLEQVPLKQPMLALVLRKRMPIHHSTVPWPEPRQFQPRSPRSNQWSRLQEPCCPRALAQLRDNPH